MHVVELAALLVEASNARREALLTENSALDPVELAYALKDICLEGWSSHPTRALGAAACLRLLSEKIPCPEITALRSWTAGLEALIRGEMEQAIADLDDSCNRFQSLEKPHTAAATQVSKLIALAMLGRYDEAIACGLNARQQFLADGDLLAAGKIEHNIGNIYFRRDRYREAEAFQRSARERFIAAADQIQITKIENSLALTLSQQHKVRAAEELYTQALERAERVGLVTTQAEIESSIGTLALYQGRYDRALDFLERSRRKYVELKMSHVSAMTEQEIADAYLELNLSPEASEIYERVTKEFRNLGMRAEAARALAYHGRAALNLGQKETAQMLFAKARDLYEAEGNEVGAAVVRLSEAQLLYAEGKYAAAQLAVTEAEPALIAAGTPRRWMFARWLKGESARAEGSNAEAQALLEAALKEAERESQPDIVARCLTSLGLLATANCRRQEAEEYFQRAITLIEELRAPLPAEEFRGAFFSDKLVPYSEMVRLCLSDTRDRTAEALAYVERARSRGLVDALAESATTEVEELDGFEKALIDELSELRYQLNYFYKHVNQRARDTENDQEEMSSLQQSIRDCEARTLEITRQLSHRRTSHVVKSEMLDVELLQERLGTERALIEYTAIDDQILAFVVTSEGIEVVQNLGNEKEVAATISQFRFQIDALRYGSQAIRSRLPILTQRVARHLELLYTKLIQPLERLIGNRHLVVVPYRSLHYLPFEALHDGRGYLIEQREITYAPSSVVLQQCLERPATRLNRALLMGVADQQTPFIREEIEALKNVFPDASVFVDEHATVDVLRSHTEADVVHLACHAQFRSDNPLFSSLQLGDGWLTVRDAHQLKLKSQLVTLSACETGLNALAPGEELIGLAKGFFSAGARAVLLSLWTVDDQATTRLMTDFYAGLRGKKSLSEALRAAQIKVLKEQPHPFFWSPFVLVGRW